MTEKPLDDLEFVYKEALAHEKAGELDAAEAAYRRVLELDPADQVGAAVRLAAIGRGHAPPKAPEAYVSALFDQHADVFDTILVDDLGYDVPLVIRDLLEEYTAPLEKVLDLGCGTGLLGEALSGRAGHITGVDLSEGMLEMSYEKGVYQELFTGDAEAFLEEGETGPWDTILAADLLPYIGNVSTLIHAAAWHLNSGGMLCFSSEALPEDVLDEQDYMINPSHRYAHSETYLKRLLTECKLEVLHFTAIILRYNEGQPVPGFLVLAQSDHSKDRQDQ